MTFYSYDEMPTRDPRDEPDPIALAATIHAAHDWTSGEPALSESPRWTEFPKEYREAYEKEWQYKYEGGMD